MKSKAATVERIVLGLVFVVFGLNKVLHFIPQPPMPPGPAAFAGGLASSGYFFPLLAATEVLAGAALLARRYVPLALAVLAPVVVNVFAFHLFLAPSGMVVAIVLLGLEVHLAWAYRSAFRSMLQARDESVAGAGESANAVHVEAHAR